MCGITAIYSFGKSNISGKLYRMLLDVQNRGELSTGITGYKVDRNKILQTFKGRGTVHEVFGKDCLNRLVDDTAAIGHVRYATVGNDELDLAQPFERIHGRKHKWFSLVFNGQITNYKELQETLSKERDYHFVLDNDTEVIVHYLAKELAAHQEPDYRTILWNLACLFKGAYVFAFLNAKGELIVARDIYGYRPVTYGYVDECLLVASESAALVNLGCKNIHSLEPGSFLHATKKGYEKNRYWNVETKPRYCFFEWVYFANVASTIDGWSVYQTRYQLGRMLGEQEDKQLLAKRPIIVPVPDTAKVAADAMGFFTGLPVREGLIRNRYIGRTFIKGRGSEQRENTVLSKYTKIDEIFRNKDIILVDDSLVRGNTMTTLVKSIRESNPKSIHLRIASPPIVDTCQYGIDIPTREELFLKDSVTTYTDLARRLGINSIRYLTIEQVRKAITPCVSNMFCDKCVTGVEKHDVPSEGAHHTQKQPKF